jgi:hypothetical protein
LLFLGACSDDNTPVIPEDADDNFITSVIITVNDQSYTANIAENTITMTVPYTVSLNNSQVKFEYTPSAAILPDPSTITDWDTERIFRVTSYNGDANEYTYKVVKDEIRYEGDVELKAAADVAAFVATDVTVIKGNLIIGSDEENADPLTDISALSLLKEVEGDIIIRDSYNGADLTGLDNITAIGGLQIGSVDAFATNSTLYMVAMKSLKNVTGNILVRNNQVAYVQFDNLAAIEGNVVFSSSSLQSFEFPKLTTVTGDFDVQGTTDDEKAGGEIVSLEIPELTTVGGKIGINNLEKLISMRFPKLKEAGSIDFASVPVLLETLSLPELSVVNGDINLTSNYVASDAFSSTGNNKLLGIDGLSNLTIVKGTLTISKFQELSELPDFSKLTKLGGITLNRLLKYYGKVLDLSNVDFEAFGDIEPTISIGGLTVISKLITKEDLSHVNIILETQANTGNPGAAINPELNFKSVKNFSDNNTATDDPVYTFEKVHGNLSLTRSIRKGLSAPNLIGVNGYLHIKTVMMASNLDFPNLESVGGQFYVEGNLNFATFKYDFSKLKTVCCANNPQYVNETTGALDIRGTNKDFTFPALERIGGTGLTLYVVKSFSCPVLRTIDGTLRAESSTSLTTFDMPQLTTLSGVKFIGLSKFTDFTMFGPFIQNAQIPESNWSVTGCGYNPTYDQMKAGQYTKP